MRKCVFGLIFVVLMMTIAIGCTTSSSGTTTSSSQGTPRSTMTASSGQAKIIGISFPQQVGSDLIISYDGNRRDDPQLSYITVIIKDGMTLNTINANGDLGTGPGVKPRANSVLTKEDVLTAGYDHIEVIGHFTDGTEQGFFDTMI